MHRDRAEEFAPVPIRCTDPAERRLHHDREAEFAPRSQSERCTEGREAQFAPISSREAAEIPLKTHVLTTSLWLNADIDRVFTFFSQAENLERLTPAFLKFRILTPTPVNMRTGTMIDYRLSLRGIPINWRSEITVWQPPHRFVDEQRKGPYRRWRHTHSFEARDGGTLVTDHVEYATWGGALVNTLVVAPDLRRIFRFRHRVLTEHFRSPQG